MYAVIETGGKQYRVEVGSELEVELLQAGPGDTVAFDRVLLIADGESASIGRPIVANASVAAEIIRRDRGEKLISFKYRPKARRRVKKGHRQELSVIRISDIVLDGRSAAAEQRKADEARKTERQRLEEAARRQAEQDAALAAKLAAEATPAKADKATKSEKAPAKAGKSTAVASKAGSAADAKASTRSRTKADTTDKGAAKASPKKTEAASPRARKSDKD